MDLNKILLKGFESFSDNVALENKNRMSLNQIHFIDNELLRATARRLEKVDFLQKQFCPHLLSSIAPFH